VNYDTGKIIWGVVVCGGLNANVLFGPLLPGGGEYACLRKEKIETPGPPVVEVVTVCSEGCPNLQGVGRLTGWFRQRRYSRPGVWVPDKAELPGRGPGQKGTGAF